MTALALFAGVGCGLGITFVILGARGTVGFSHPSKLVNWRGDHNGAQRIAYSSIILMGAGSLLTGLAIYKPTQFAWLTALLGGYPAARWEHSWSGSWGRSF